MDIEGWKKGNYESMSNVLDDNVDVLKDIDSSLLGDEGFVRAAVKVNWRALRYAHESLRKDKEIVRTACEKNALALIFAHQELKGDKQFFLEILKVNREAIIFADRSWRMDSKFWLAVDELKLYDSTYPFYIDTDSLESNDHEKEITKASKSQIHSAIFEPAFLRWVPKVDKGLYRSLCLHAVKNNGLTLKWVAPNFRTEEICLQAVENNPSSIRWVPSGLLYSDFFSKIVEKNPKAFLKLSTKHKELVKYVFAERFHELILNCWEILKFLTVDEQRRWSYLLQEEKNLIKYFHPSIISFQDMECVLKQDGMLLQYLSDANSYSKDELTKLVEMALKNDGMALQFASPEFKCSKRFIEIAMKSNHAAISFADLKAVPSDVRLELCKRSLNALFEKAYISQFFPTSDAIIERKNISLLGFPVSLDIRFHVGKDGFATIQLINRSIHKGNFRTFMWLSHTNNRVALLVDQFIEKNPILEGRIISNVSVHDVNPDSKRLEFKLLFTKKPEQTIMYEEKLQLDASICQLLESEEPKIQYQLIVPEHITIVQNLISREILNVECLESTHTHQKNRFFVDQCRYFDISADFVPRISPFSWFLEQLQCRKSFELLESFVKSLSIKVYSKLHSLPSICIVGPYRILQDQGTRFGFRAKTHPNKVQQLQMTGYNIVFLAFENSMFEFIFPLFANTFHRIILLCSSTEDGKKVDARNNLLISDDYKGPYVLKFANFQIPDAPFQRSFNLDWDENDFNSLQELFTFSSLENVINWKFGLKAIEDVLQFISNFESTLMKEITDHHSIMKGDISTNLPHDVLSSKEALDVNEKIQAILSKYQSEVCTIEWEKNIKAKIQAGISKAKSVVFPGYLNTLGKITDQEAKEIRGKIQTILSEAKTDIFPENLNFLGKVTDQETKIIKASIQVGNFLTKFILDKCIFELERVNFILKGHIKSSESLHRMMEYTDQINQANKTTTPELLKSMTETRELLNSTTTRWKQAMTDEKEELTKFSQREYARRITYETHDNPCSIM